MKAAYEMTLKLTFLHDVDSLENLKDHNEYAKNVVTMICDEATQTDTVVTFDILETAVNVS